MAEYTCHGCGERRIFGVKHVCFSRVAPPPASLGDEERARLWALERTHDKSWTFEMLYKGALWGLRTSRAEVLAEREKVRKLREMLDGLKRGLELSIDNPRSSLDAKANKIHLDRINGILKDTAE